MAQKVYVLMLHVGESKLGAVINAVAGEASIVSVAPTKESAEIQGLPKISRFVSGKKDKGISGKDLLEQLLSSSNRAFSITEIVDEFKKHEFAPSSGYNVTATAVREGRVRALSGGRYALPHVALKLADLGAVTGASGE